MLERAADFEARFGEEEAGAGAEGALGSERLEIAGRGEIERIVDGDVAIGAEAAAEHGAGAGVARADADGKNQRVGLEIADPDGIEALVIDAERRQKSAGGDGQIWIGDEIDLGVFEFFFHLAVETGAARELHHVGLEGAAGFEEPAITEGDEDYAGEDWAEMGISALERGDEAGAAGEEGDGFVVVELLGSLVWSVERLRMERWPEKR